LKGYGFVPDSNTCNFTLGHRADKDDWEVSIKKFRQQHLPILDAKRGLSENRLKRNFVKEGILLTLEKCQEQIDFEKEQHENSLKAAQENARLEFKRMQ